MASAPRIFQLVGTCNNYDWGKKGRNSLAARMCEKATPAGFEIKDDEPYSEMWFGDYPDFPGRVAETGEPLADYLGKHKEELLGAKILKELDAQLPFLPKILSIAKALPLQIHPNKQLSERLHQEQPDKFTDPNHKPEIAVALSRFEVFAGWKPVSQISPLFKTPALAQFVPSGTKGWTNDTLRHVVRKLLKADEETVRSVENEIAKLSNQDLQKTIGEDYMVDLIHRLQTDYGSTDPGTLVALLCMNYLVLEPGEALYIPADGIHAYLSGDIVECMARSNNVLNVGFCPPADRDNSDLFTELLTFGPDSRGDITLPRQKSEAGVKGRTSVYRPPIREFDMLRIDLGANEDEEIQALEGPGIGIVTHGTGILHGDDEEIAVKEADILYVAPQVQTKWRTSSDLQVHMAVFGLP
ncbi:unnamed protein product [Clonostachys rosea f. rosea IK726]|uniref:Mannose-6-phosphate isomerase n=2 Tax=Bionectria ochroleuca TaxID=29856 RepID=A0A0B7KLL9_BIOOC|nr:unnamed protein product [Clonostachys rosea f. rosea IK726]